MISINTDNAVAVGTVAAGGAAASVVNQHYDGIKRTFITPAKDTFKKALEEKKPDEVKNEVKNQVKSGAKKAKNAAKNNVKKNAKKGSKKLKETLVNAKETIKTKLKNGKDAVVNKAKAAGRRTVSMFDSLIHRTDWKRVGKTAAVAGGIAVATIGVKKAYNHFFGDEA